MEPRSSIDSAALARFVRHTAATVDADVVASRSSDWTGHWRGDSPALVRPATTAALSEALAAASNEGVPVQIQGGNTSLTGGATPFGEVILSTSELQRFDVDVAAGRVTAEAGVTAGVIGAALAGTEWELGCDLASRDSATIGGMISTNAGGLRVLRHGQMAAQVLGLHVVCGDGTSLEHLDPPGRDNTGPRYEKLFCGAEGIFGVVAAATLRLAAREDAATALLGFETAADAAAFAAPFAARASGVRSVELMCSEGMALVADLLDVDVPFPGCSGFLLVEVAGTVAALGAAIDAAISASGVTVVDDAVSDGARRQDLWRWRERHTEAIAAVGVAAKCDVSVPPSRVVELVEGVGTAARGACASATVVRFGHVAEGNVHVNVLGGDSHSEAAVLMFASQLGGSISAEHGIGRQKRRLLALSRSSSEIAAFEGLKSVFDPRRVCNPNILIPQ